MPLRRLTDADLGMILPWRNAPDVRRYMYTSHEISEGEHRAWFERLQADTTAQWFIHENDSGQPDGVVNFTQIHPGRHSAFWGFYAAPNAPAGTGTRIGLDALDYAFGFLRLHRLNGETLASNEPSLRLHHKLGFREEGLFRDDHYDGDRYVDVVRLGLLAEEWAAIRPVIVARITQLDALARGASSGGGYHIVILSDRESWIGPYMDDLVEDWSAAGHACQVAHRVADAPPGDFCFCLSFGQIVSAEVRARYRHTLVVHAGDLPKGRGWSPMTWQILEGQNRIPVTLLEAVDAVDAGPIYRQEWIELDGTELATRWRQSLASMTVRLCTEWLADYPKVLAKAREQTGEPTYYRRRRPEHSRLDPDQSLGAQFDLLRVVDNDRYPAFFEMRGKRYVLAIHSAEERVQ